LRQQPPEFKAEVAPVAYEEIELQLPTLEGPVTNDGRTNPTEDRPGEWSPKR
jgi:hypothetical protein